ncbi:MAG: N-acetylmuramoyl-L-alanine amidase [Oscillospiraceae bacterium]|nr:N-acetylmuramoyl-L-alanine amidase [Oscillospiraceae bacterium]
MKAKIGIDAGHGGASSGTYSVKTTADGLFEKDFTLELALLVEKKLLANGFSVVMSRREDKNPGTVSERAKKMAAEKVDFALSIHFNGFGSESANGTEVFVPHGETAAKIEAALFEKLGGFFRVRVPFARSNSFFDRNKTFDKKLNLKTEKFDTVSAEKDYFGFIRTCWESGISADLLEICFLTNEKDFAVYSENREEIADEIAKSIVEAFGEKYIFEKAEEIPRALPRIRHKYDVIN